MVEQNVNNGELKVWKRTEQNNRTKWINIEKNKAISMNRQLDDLTRQLIIACRYTSQRVGWIGWITKFHIYFLNHFVLFNYEINLMWKTIINKECELSETICNN